MASSPVPQMQMQAYEYSLRMRNQTAPDTEPPRTPKSANRNPHLSPSPSPGPGSGRRFDDRSNFDSAPRYNLRESTSAARTGSPFKFFYAVAEGQSPGVYSDWPSCKEAVGNVRPRTFRKFSDRDEAVSFILKHGSHEKIQDFLRSEGFLDDGRHRPVAATAETPKGDVAFGDITNAFGQLSVYENTSTSPTPPWRVSPSRKSVPSRPSRPVSSNAWSEPEPWTEWSGPSLITNFGQTPKLVDLLRHEMRAPGLASVSIMCSYIKDRGVDVLDEAFADLESRRIPVRLVTTSQLGLTEAKAVQRLAQRRNIAVRIFNSSRPSFHAKAWLFIRADGGAVAVVGSSNISWSALHTSQEWNTRLQRDPARPSHHDAALDTAASCFQDVWDWTEHVIAYTGSSNDLATLGDRLRSERMGERDFEPTEFEAVGVEWT